MKPILIGLLTISFLTLHIRASIWNQEPQNFIRGNTYEFQYSSQVLTGLHKTSSENMGLQINTVVELFFETQSIVIMTLRDTEILESTKDIRTQNPEMFIDKIYFKRLLDIDQAILKSLSFPVKYKWTLDEKISDFQTVTSDEMFSVNIKRGVMNLLNMKLKLNTTDWDDNGGSYIVKEDEGIEGTCSATYIWFSYPYQTLASKNKNVRSLSLTRTKSANKCTKPRGYDVTNFAATSKSNDLNRTFIKNENVNSMNLSLWKSNRFFVWEAQSRSSYTIEENNHRKESISTVAIQTLKFVKATKKSRLRKAVPSKPESLMMQWIDPRMIRSNFPKKQILELVSKLGNEDKNIVSELIPLLRGTYFTHLKIISDMIAKESPNLMKLYVNVLAQVMTPFSVRIIVEEFILKPKSDVDDDNAMASLISPMAGLSHVTDIRLINFLMTAVTNKVLRNHIHRTNTLKTSLMTLGSVIGKYYSENPNYDIKRAIDFFSVDMMNQKCNLSPQEKTIVMLKSLGNIGAIQCLPNLRKVLKNKNSPHAYRVQAIHSMRKLVRRDPEIENLLLALFADIGEDVELRIAAGVDLVLRHTTESTLDAVANHLMSEPIKQVKSFMQDFIVNLSQRPGIGGKFLALLKRIKLENYSDEFSKVYSFPVKSGITWISVVYNPESQYPRSGSLIFIDKKFDKEFRPMEIQFELIIPKDIKQKSIFNVENILNVALKVSYKIYDNDISYWTLDSKALKTFGFKSLDDFERFLKGHRILNLKYFLLMHGELVLPTTSGLLYSARTHSMINLQIDITCSKQYREKLDSDEFKISVNPSVTIESAFEVGIDAMFIKSEIISVFQLRTPNPTTINVFINENGRSFSIGLIKPHKDVHIFAMYLEKQFKITYKSNKLSEVRKDIGSLNGKRSNQKSLDTKNYPFFFGRSIKLVYYTDFGKSINSDNSFSWLAAGGGALDVWIYKKDSSQLKKLKHGLKNLFSPKSSQKFDEITLELSGERSDKVGEYIVKINYFRVGKVKSSITLMVLRLTNRIDLTWPERMNFDEDVLQLPSKKPTIKYARFSGSFQQPSLMKFNPNDPLKIVAYKKEYSYNFGGSIKNSIGNPILNIKILIGMSSDTINLAKDIAKNPSDYKERGDVLLRCREDIKRRMPNSPACIQSWLKLNTHNQVSAFITWNKEGSSVVSEMFNKLIQHLPLSSFLISQQINVSSATNVLKVTYTTSLFPQSSSNVTMTVSALTNVYGMSTYPSLNVADKIVRTFKELTIDKRGHKMCQIMFGKGDVAMVKTFDDYFYNSKPLQRIYKENDARRIVLVQDEKRVLQISEIRTSTKYIIQIIGEGHPLIRLVMKRNKFTMESNEEIVTNNVVMMENIIFATMSRISNTIYGPNSLYEFIFPILKIRILTNLENTIFIEASVNYRSTLRGVCGDMDLELFNEFKNADCSGIYRSPEEIFVKSDYESVFRNYKTNSAIVQFIPMKKCMKSQLLSLI